MENTQSIDYIKQAFELKESKNYKHAIEMLYKVLEIENDNLEILSQIGELYFLMNNYTRAVQYFEKVLQIDSSHVNSLKYMRIIKERLGDLDSSLEFAQKIFEVSPGCENLKDLIKVLVKLNLFCEIDKYIDSEFFNDDVKFECINALYSNGEQEKAKNLLQTCDIDDENVLFIRGKIKFDENDFEGAEEIFNRIGKNSQNPEILNYLGLFELERMDFINAIKNFSKAANLDKSNSLYYFNLGNAYFYNGWMEEAQKAYQKALYINPENIDYRYALAYLHYDCEEFVKAQTEIDAILEANVHHSQAKVLKALLLAQNKDYIGACKILEQNLKDGNSDDFTKSSLSKIYVELNMFSKAEELIGEIVKNNPENLNYMTELGELYFKIKNYDKANEVAEKILEINSNYIAGDILGAKSSFEKGDLELAKTYAQDAISLDINCSQGYYYLALVREKSGDIEEAIECMKRAILYDLNNPKYYVKMSEFYQAIGKYEDAFAYIKEASDIDKSAKNQELYMQLAGILRRKGIAQE